MALEVRVTLPSKTRSGNIAGDDGQWNQFGCLVPHFEDIDKNANLAELHHAVNRCRVGTAAGGNQIADVEPTFGNPAVIRRHDLLELGHDRVTDQLRPYRVRPVLSLDSIGRGTVVGSFFGFAFLVGNDAFG